MLGTDGVLFLSILLELSVMNETNIIDKSIHRFRLTKSSVFFILFLCFIGFFGRDGEVTAAPLPEVKINEIFPNAVGSDMGHEWVELYNNGDNTVDISGWLIQTATSSFFPVFVLPASTFIEPGTFLVIGDELVEFADFNLPLGTSLSLGNATSSGDAIRILDANSTIIDTVVYGNNNNDMFLDDTGAVASSLAPIGAAGESITRNVDGLDTDASGDDFFVSNPTPGSTHIVKCNTNTVQEVTEYAEVTHEACEILLLGPSFVAANGSSVSVNSGWEIDFLPGFLIEKGATLSANVCGLSLCLTSLSPMPDGCHSCVNKICDIDATCCEVDFDQTCLDMVDTECGLVCEMKTYSIDFCRLQHPPFVEAPSGSAVDVYGRVWVAGVTDVDQTSNDPTPGLVGYVGYGPDNSSPSDNWTWTTSIPNPNYIADSESSLDEYKAVLTLPESGEYDFAFRFSGDNGNTFTYCDLNEGSANGYSPADAGQLTVLP